MSAEIAALPLYPHLDEIAAALATHHLLMLHAEPGAGKTTLVPWRLLAHPALAGAKFLLLQPRRIAARAAAERIAALLGEKLGRTVGLRTRLETIVSPSTRLEVVTEGVLTRIIQNDPALSGYGLVIFDEFHERNLQGDVALAFTWECRAALRRDLRILFMSATPPAEALRAAVGEIPVISVPGRSWPVRLFDRPPLKGEMPGTGAARLAIEARKMLDAEGGGDVLVFLPGFREIRQAREELLRMRPHLGPEVAILHGRLPPEEQRRLLATPSGASRRIILATNVAETSLTIPGVRAVVDSGLERRVRFHPRTGMDHWETVEISAASATQRQGRAGRLGPGICLRWYRSADPRKSFSPPEIMEADLAAVVLETAFWGAATPLDLTWITPPPAGALKQAAALLEELGLVDGRGRITDDGRLAARMGLHPRLGRMVMKAGERGWLATAAVAAAILEESDPLKGDDPDFRDRLSAWAAWAAGARNDLRPDAGPRIAREAERIVRAAGAAEGTIHTAEVDPSLAGRLLVLAYPDRAAQRVGPGGIEAATRLVLATGRGARIKGALGQEEFLVVADLDGGETEARVFLAAPVSRADVESGLAGPVATSLLFSWEGWTPRTRAEVRVGRLLLGDKRGAVPSPADIRQAARERLAREGLETLPWNDAARRFRARCLFVGRCGRDEGWPDFSSAALWDDLDQWLFPFGHWEGGRAVFTAESLFQALAGRLGWERRRALDEAAPEAWLLPSGTRKRIDYEAGDVPVLAARLQEFFGCRETPLLCGRPLTLHLLSPAGRPVQITEDLDGFWERSYPAVKKELMGRYPRHHWPDDPRAAAPTAKTKKKRI
ncbi:MAG: ATP-dependent helicase HrpB [Deltaproteobacteria bacterium]|nr:ATP-dependent helicase HrpB [Deltaproteobacteria bacterium]